MLQKALVEINEDMNSYRNALKGVRVLFMGKEEVFEAIKGGTSIEFYEKEAENNMLAPTQNFVVVIGQEDGEQQILASLEYGSKLKNMIRIINKDKVKKFAMKFSVD